MRILVVSNYYPPFFVGGYELGCQRVVEALRKRGHVLQVLTSDYQVSSEGAPQSDVRRQLRLRKYPDYSGRNRATVGLHNVKEFRKAAASFQPDLIYAWNLHSLGIPLIREIEEHPVPHVYYVSDLWMLGPAAGIPPALQEKPNSIVPKMRSLLSLARSITTGEKIPSQFTNLQCCSQFVLSKIANAGAAAGDCEVIHWGVELANIVDSMQNSKESSRLLYVGQVERHKGVHTAVKAFSILRREMPDVTLTIVGSSSSQSYEAELRQLANETGASPAISFLGRVSAADLGAVFAKHDILLFTSEWDEPFAITPLEAMLSRLAVVATTTGGSREIFENNINALTFEAGNPDDCARQTLKLLKDPTITERLANAGHDLVRNRFSLGAMIDKIDNHIRRVVLQAQKNS